VTGWTSAVEKLEDHLEALRVRERGRFHVQPQELAGGVRVRLDRQPGEQPAVRLRDPGRGACATRDVHPPPVRGQRGPTLRPSDLPIERYGMICLLKGVERRAG